MATRRQFSGVAVGAYMFASNLFGANLKGADTTGAIFTDANLKESIQPDGTHFR